MQAARQEITTTNDVRFVLPPGRVSPKGAPASVQRKLPIPEHPASPNATGTDLTLAQRPRSLCNSYTKIWRRIHHPWWVFMQDSSCQLKGFIRFQPHSPASPSLWLHQGAQEVAARKLGPLQRHLVPSRFVAELSCSHTSSIAQGGGRSFKIGNLQKRLVAVNHGRQSEATDGSICLSIYLSWVVS